MSCRDQHDPLNSACISTSTTADMPLALHGPMAAIRQETEVTQTALRLSRLTVMLNITQYFFADAEGLHSAMSPAPRPHMVNDAVTRQSPGALDLLRPHWYRS